MTSAPCPICSGTGVSSVSSNSYYYYRCNQCETAFVHPQPDAAHLSNFYDNFHLSNAQGGLYDETDDRVKLDFPAKLDLIKRFIKPTNARLLDVGCGKGFFISAAQKVGFNAEGIDLSSTGIEFATKVLNVKATRGHIEDLATSDFANKFDAVTFFATIEHLPDPVSTLKAIHTSLKPGGYLVCDTGCGSVSSEKLLAGHNQWFDAPQHLFVFSERGILNALQDAGFKVIHCDSNFERSVSRRIIKAVRNALICYVAYALLRPLLGKKAFHKMQREAKWSIGKLMAVVAQKV